MVYPDIAQELIDRRRHDLDVRQRLSTEGKLFGGYNPDMEAVHLDIARRLQELIGQIGWPAQEQVGEEASQAAWLIVQHAISLPSFMKNALALMNEQEKTRTIDPVNLAFLSDRIAMYENRPQSYGTQFVNDEQGRLIPYQLDESIDQVNQRRQSLGLNTIEQRLAELTAQMNVESEKQPTATDRQLAKADYDAWRRKVGWISAVEA
jgi:23S rRNA maturation mini-RNase III